MGAPDTILQALDAQFLVDSAVDSAADDSLIAGLTQRLAKIESELTACRQQLESARLDAQHERARADGYERALSGVKGAPVAVAVGETKPDVPDLELATAIGRLEGRLTAIERAPKPVAAPPNTDALTARVAALEAEEKGEDKPAAYDFDMVRDGAGKLLRVRAMPVAA